MLRRALRLCAPLVLALAFGSLVAAQPTDYATAGQELTQPTEHVAVGGAVVVTINVDQFYYDGHTNTGRFWTRAYNGGLPGPTIRASQCDTVTVHLVNNLLPNPTTTTTHNTYHSPNTTNFHTHGLHVTSLGTSDNVFLTVEPQTSQTYTFEIPCDHHEGTNWYHAHKHSATALQVGAGMSGSLIIEDAAGNVPEEIRTMPERILLFQEYGFSGVADVRPIANAAGDTLLSTAAFTLADYTAPAGSFWLVNGFYQPKMTIDVGQWYRIRSIYSGSFEGLTWFVTPGGCNMMMLAKDGTYLPDAPRTATEARMMPGNRVDMAIRCNIAQTFTVRKRGQGGPQNDVVLMTIDAVASIDPPGADLSTVNYKYPGYLTDLTDLTGVSATVETQTVNFTPDADGCGINGVKFAGEGNPNFVVNIGTIQEWTLLGISVHPFHIHVGPYQIVNIATNDYHQVGDWYDVLNIAGVAGDVTIRFQPDRFTGHYIMHCHLLPHEDLGCMGYAEVTGAEGTVCPHGCIDNTWIGAKRTYPSPAPEVGAHVHSGRCRFSHYGEDLFVSCLAGSVFSLVEYNGATGIISSQHTASTTGSGAFTADSGTLSFSDFGISTVDCACTPTTTGCPASEFYSVNLPYPQDTSSFYAKVDAGMTIDNTGSDVSIQYDSCRPVMGWAASSVNSAAGACAEAAGVLSCSGSTIQGSGSLVQTTGYNCVC